MGKRKFNAIAVGFAVLVLLMAALLMTNSLRRSSHIVLPDTSEAPVSSADHTQQAGDSVVQIEVTPETVQSAIKTLARPENYAHYLTIETFWSGGSGSTEITTAVSGTWTRTDADQPNGRVRHAITNGEDTYIWYDSSKSYYSGSAGDISSDNEQHIPTYEDILKLDSHQISAADYRVFSDEDCIYVETAKDTDGYVQRYWVSVSSGLLVGAEKLQNGETIYRMAVQTVSETVPTSADFTLPDGTCLHTVK